jgi:hypothetical protein
VARVYRGRPGAHVDRHAKRFQDLLARGAVLDCGFDMKRDAVVAARRHRNPRGNQLLGLRVERALRERACAIEENAFITSGAPPRRFLSSELSDRVNSGQFVVSIVVLSCWFESRGLSQLYEKAVPALTPGRLKIVTAGRTL